MKLFNLRNEFLSHCVTKAYERWDSPNIADVESEMEEKWTALILLISIQKTSILKVVVACRLADTPDRAWIQTYVTDKAKTNLSKPSKIGFSDLKKLFNVEMFFVAH